MPIVALAATLNTAMLVLAVSVEEPAGTPPVQLVVVSHAPLVVPDQDWAWIDGTVSNAARAAKRGQDSRVVERLRAFIEWLG